MISLIIIIKIKYFRGFIRLRSKNPDDKPLIIPKYFQEPEDLIPFIEAFKFGKKLAAAFEDGTVFQNGHFPGCSDHEIGIDILFPSFYIA